MQCLTPITVHKGTESESVVPCGKCPACRANRRQEWIIRLKSEYFSSIESHFITLTYDDQHLPITELVDSNTGEILTKAYPDKVGFQKFLKRLRKNLSFSFRYFSISEYGDKTLRPHWHMLLFFNEKNSDRRKFYDIVKSSWQQGNVMFGKCEEGSITYCTKYMFKPSDYPLGIKDTKMLCSRRPAIGSEFIERQKSFNLSQRNFSGIMIYGNKSRLPRLFREKWKNEFCGDDEELKLQLKADYTKKLLSHQSALQQEFQSSSFTSIADFLLWKREQEEKIRSKHIVKHDKI